MSSQGIPFILTVLVAIPCACVPIMLAFQLGLVFLWWGQDAEAFFGLLLLVGLVPMIIAAVAAVVVFFVISAYTQWRRWFMNGIAVGLFSGVASLVSIELGEGWTGALWVYLMVSGVVTSCLGLVLLLSLNRTMDGFLNEPRT